MEHETKHVKADRDRLLLPDTSKAEEDNKVPTSLLPGVMERLQQRNTYIAEQSSLQDLQQALHHAHWEIRAAAAKALGEQIDQTATQNKEALITALYDDHRLVRVAAVRALGKMAEQAPIELFVLALQDHEWEVREMVVLTLGELEQHALRPLLQAALHDNNSSVREAVTQVLARWDISNTASSALNASAQESGFTEIVKSKTLHLYQVFSRQLLVMPKSIWLTTPLLMLACGGIAILFALTHLERSIAFLDFLLTFSTIASAVIGAALCFGARNDPGLEVTLSTPTSVRLIAFSRITLVCLYTIVFALLASFIVVLIDQGNFWQVIQLWLGPVLFLSALSLALSLLLGSLFAILASLLGALAQSLIVESGTLTLHLASGQTNSITLSLAACLFVLAIFYTPHAPAVRVDSLNH